MHSENKINNNRKERNSMIRFVAVILAIFGVIGAIYGKVENWMISQDVVKIMEECINNDAIIGEMRCGNGHKGEIDHKKICSMIDVVVLKGNDNAIYSGKVEKIYQITLTNDASNLFLVKMQKRSGGNGLTTFMTYNDELHNNVYLHSDTGLLEYLQEVCKE